MILALKRRLSVFLFEPITEECKETFMVLFRFENNYFSSLLISKVKIELTKMKTLLPNDYFCV